MRARNSKEQGIATVGVLLAISVFTTLVVAITGTILVDTQNTSRAYRNIVAASFADAGAERVLWALNTGNGTCADFVTPGVDEGPITIGTLDIRYHIESSGGAGSCDMESEATVTPAGSTDVIGRKVVRLIGAQTISTGFVYAAQAGYGGLQTSGTTTIAGVGTQPPSIHSNGEIIFSSNTVYADASLNDGEIVAADDCWTWYLNNPGDNRCGITLPATGGANPPICTTLPYFCNNPVNGRHHISMEANGSTIFGAVYTRYEYNANIVGGNPSRTPTLCASNGGYNPTQPTAAPAPSGQHYRGNKNACEQDRSGETDPVNGTTNIKPLPTVPGFNSQLSQTDGPTQVPGTCPANISGTHNWGGSGQVNYFNCDVNITGPGTTVNIHGPVHITGNLTINQAVVNLSSAPATWQYILLIADKKITLQAGADINGDVLNDQFILLYSRWCESTSSEIGGGTLNNCGTTTPTDAQLHYRELWEDDQSGEAPAVSVQASISTVNTGLYAVYGLLSLQAGVDLSFIVGQRIEMTAGGNISFTLPVSSGAVVTYTPSGYTVRSN